MKAKESDRRMYDNDFSGYSAKDKLVLTLIEAVKDTLAKRYFLATDTLKVALDYAEELRAEKGVEK